MHIGIDYTPAALQGAGIGRYTRGLVDALLPLLDGQDRVTLMMPRGETPFARRSWPTGVVEKRLPLPERGMAIAWHRLRIPLAVDRLAGNPDTFHAPDFLLPPVHSARALLTIHDMAFLVYPQYAHPRLQKYLSAAVPRSVARADHILADSEATKRDAMNYLGLPSERITVVGAGVEGRFQPQSEAGLADLRRKLGLPWPFVLSLSTLEPRKNFDGLIRAFAKARRQASFPHHLVIAGGKGWLTDGIFAAVDETNSAEFVHFTGFLDDADLPGLYNLADLFVLASHYEGFGLGVLEALACGTAVICTNTSSLPEVAGNAALLVPVGNDDALADAIANLLTDDSARAEFARKGPPQAKSWTWQAAAHRLLDVYRDVSS